MPFTARYSLHSFSEFVCLLVVTAHFLCTPALLEVDPPVSGEEIQRFPGESQDWPAKSEADIWHGGSEERADPLVETPRNDQDQLFIAQHQPEQETCDDRPDRPSTQEEQDGNRKSARIFTSSEGVPLRLVLSAGVMTYLPFSSCGFSDRCAGNCGGTQAQ